MGFVGAIGKPVPMGAKYIYNLNFFCGFIVSASTYYALCNFFPVPATSDVWMEVGDDITDPTMAYGNETGSEYDEERATGKDAFKGGEVSEMDGKRDLEM